VARAVFGLDPAVTGTIEIDGRTVTIRSPRKPCASALGLFEDRKRQG
jgi:ABC-type sugar transport system ATPase subunit